MHLESDGDPDAIKIRDYDPEPPSEPGQVWTVSIDPVTGETVAWRVLSEEEVSKWQVPPDSR